MGVGYYAAISKWRWYLHVFVGSYVSFGRSSYRRVLQWKLGVTEDFHYGGDELIRVADVGTQSGVFRRTVQKHCPLPVDAE